MKREGFPAKQLSQSLMFVSGMVLLLHPQAIVSIRRKDTLWLRYRLTPGMASAEVSSGCHL